MSDASGDDPARADPSGVASTTDGGPVSERRPYRALEVDDPVALRALAHPARQRLIAELLAGRVMTATEAADLVGLSPSAVSHHLRALERYGIAERADPAADGRTRPWRSRVTELNFSPRSPGGAQAINVVMQQELARMARNISAALTPGDRSAGDAPSRTLTFSSSETWLTDTERADLVERLERVLRDLPERHSADHPEGATRMQLTLSLVPVADPG